jgi:voltage-gated potassium channel
LTVGALLFLVAYAVPIVWPGVSESARDLASGAVALTWAMFGVDYLVRLVVAEDRRRFFVSNLFDLLVLVLPLLRPLRLLRLVTLLSVLNRTGSQGLRGRVVTYAAGGTALLVLCGALAITDAERAQPDATITGFPDGLWWAVTTMTTVGYGDTYPTTATGRVVATVLMLGGIALLGVVTATLASWLVERVTEANEAEQAATRAQVADLSAQVASLETLLRGALGTADDPTTRRAPGMLGPPGQDDDSAGTLGPFSPV